MLFFAAFASENKSEILPKKEISNTKIRSQKKNLVQSKKQKLNFKERLALKLIEKKIRKSQKKQAKNKKSKTEDFGANLVALLLILAAATGIIGGIIYLTLGNILAGILLILGGIILIPLFILIYMIISIVTWEA
jgi:Flp pilus assembly protein TadB